MNKTQEALELAIEALEEAQDMIGDGGSSIPDYFKKQINACKEALAEPNHKWVGMSDEEVQTVFELGHHSYKEFAKAIEAKIKELNT
jgi:hypothetical protein